jgi:glycosyltransferase involved in cell wall biosynthesis
MKIVYVTASMPYGPGETFLIDEVRELRRRGHQVLVVPRSPKRAAVHAPFLADSALREDLYSYRVLRDALRVFPAVRARAASSALALLRVRRAAVGMKNLAILPKALWLARTAREWKADHIHCHWAGTTASMAMVASAGSGIPWSFTAHRWDIVENNALAAKVRSASFVRVISNNGRRLMRALGIDHDQIHVLRMGVNIPAQAAWTPPARPVVLCPANLVAVKGHRFLIEAWRILRDRGLDGELWLAGDGELRRPLEDLAARLHPGGHVKFLGVVNHERLLSFYQSGSVSAVALASVDLGRGAHEGVPVALVEAMSYGVPVVATNTGAIPELVNANTGILVPPANAAALAEALERALTQRFAVRAAALGRQYVVEHHDVSTIAATLERWFAAATVRPERAVGSVLCAQDQA